LPELISGLIFSGTGITESRGRLLPHGKIQRPCRYVAFCQLKSGWRISGNSRYVEGKIRGEMGRRLYRCLATMETILGQRES
jgi:hypothetical protein